MALACVGALFMNYRRRSYLRISALQQCSYYVRKGYRRSEKFRWISLQLLNWSGSGYLPYRINSDLSQTSRSIRWYMKLVSQLDNSKRKKNWTIMFNKFKVLTDYFKETFGKLAARRLPNPVEIYWAYIWGPSISRLLWKKKCGLVVNRSCKRD